MISLRILALFLTALFSFALTAWGFIGFLPSWAGGLAWLFLTFVTVKELCNIYEVGTKVDVRYTAADIIEELERTKGVHDE